MRLRSRKQYQRMGWNAIKYTGRWILADIRVTNATYSRLGITVTKRFGQAVQRNRFKRIVREAFRLSCSHLIPTFDVVVRPRSQALRAKRDDIQRELLEFIESAFQQLG